MDLPESVELAKRTIKSALTKSNLTVNHYSAVTPKDNPKFSLELSNVNTEGFVLDTGSRPNNVLAAFHSHYNIWQEASVAHPSDIFIIFEHDAVVLDQIPYNTPFKQAMTIGAPSYGKFQSPKSLGINPLTSKKYFPGAHAYMIRPSAARAFIEQSRKIALATDIFLNQDYFPFLEEYYPWPVIAKDTFSTIQNISGCVAKHSYNKGNGYEIIKVD